MAAKIVLTSDPRETRIDAAGLASAPPALGSRVVKAALEQHAGSKPISFDHVEQVLALAAAGGGAISLPGQDALRFADLMVLRVRTANREPRTANHFVFSLSIPGEVRLAVGGFGPGAVSAEVLAGTDARAARPTEWAARGLEVGVSAGALTLPLAVRGRRPGDRFRPLGAPGKRKLQDFLVDRKVPREQRDTVPLVVDGQDRIVWVVGQSVGEEFRVTDPSLGVILLKVRHLGGVG